MKILSIKLHHVDDIDPDLSYLDKTADAERLSSFGYSWNMLGVYVSADVQTSDRGVIQTIRSGGVYGVESDSGKDYLDELETEEILDLTSELLAIGFSEDAVNVATQNVERETA